LAVLKETMDVFQVPYRIRELSRPRSDRRHREVKGYDTFVVRPKTNHARSMVVELTAYRSFKVLGKIPCPSCDRLFVNEAQLANHRRARHSPVVLEAQP
jgi:hypothetical protein